MDSTETRRRLATILAADVVGYSRLMAEDEEATLRGLRAHRTVIDRLIARHDGRIFNTGGDSVLAEFGSAVEAVRCAIAVQEELRLRNAELVEARRLHFRIGINVGDVFAEGGDLLGDGVNVAARLEGLAQPGGICISGSTFEQVKNKLSVGFEDLGPQQVKNIPEPVAAFSITAAPVTVAAKGAPPAGAPWRAWRSPLATAAAALGIALLAAGLWVWLQPAGGSRPLASFPENTSTDSLSQDEIAALMAGVTISGARSLDERPFTMRLNADGSLIYTFGGEDGAAAQSLTGRWWSGEQVFCLQVAQFAQGRRACPRIVKAGTTLTAVRTRDGEVLPWTLTK